MADLDKLSGELGHAQTDLYNKEEEFAPVAEHWDDLFNDLLTTLLSDYEDGDKKDQRLPGEDVRNALVVKKMRETEPILFGQYRRLKKEIDRKERWTKRLEKRISSKQSQLSFLKVEASAIQ